MRGHKGHNVPRGDAGSYRFCAPRRHWRVCGTRQRGKSGAESRGGALWRTQSSGKRGPGWLHPAGGVRGRLLCCRRSGFCRLPGLHCQPCSIETLSKSSKSDTIPPRPTPQPADHCTYLMGLYVSASRRTSQRHAEKGIKACLRFRHFCRIDNSHLTVCEVVMCDCKT